MAIRHFYRPKTGASSDIMERLSGGLMRSKIAFRYEANDTLLYRQDGRLVIVQREKNSASVTAPFFETVIVRCETPQACVGEKKIIEQIINCPLILDHSEKVGRLS